MADPFITNALVVTLAGGDMTVDSEGEIRDRANLPEEVSKTQARRAMGSLIKDQIVRRHRCEPERLDQDESTPITYRLIVQI